ncbi:hypothetical protein JD844_005115 [Phrynosoma platyrhinos]|uniref:Uncharacterized protein n=1 Tax=Phrynosoma platyrhinos TaxID=52577 RepID=A0ABQ7SE96_PHRPL|nr:hypothetical protein JD844_005115 [Phrynosoma platyrhinos]
MVSVDAGQWDETICTMLACQHPPCWEALRRVESGHPRTLLGAPGRHSAEYEGELPTLKIVNLPLNCSWREKIKCSESYGSISKTISSMKDNRSYLSNSTQNDILIPPVSVVSSERDPFPGLNSRIDSHTPHFLPMSFTCWRQAEKMQVTDVSEFAIHRLGYQLPCGNLVVRWIPSTRPKPLQPKKPATRAVIPSQRICVKDLLLESNLAFKEKRGEMKRKKSSKVPTGGQPYLLHLRKKKQVPADKSSPVGNGKNAKRSVLGKSQFSSYGLQLASVVPSQAESNSKMESRRGASLESKEKGAPPLFTVQKAPSLYRFEPKIPMKEECSRRTHRLLRVPSGGLVPRWHLMPGLVEQLDRADDPSHKMREGRGKTTQKFQEASAEDCRPPGAPETHPRKKQLVKSVECKSVRNNQLTVGYNNFVPWISRTESQFNQYRKPLASRKETPPPLRDSPPATLSSRRQPMEAPPGTLGQTLPQLQGHRLKKSVSCYHTKVGNTVTTSSLETWKS